MRLTFHESAGYRAVGAESTPQKAFPAARKASDEQVRSKKHEIAARPKADAKTTGSARKQAQEGAHPYTVQGAFAKNRPNSKSRRVPLARRKRPRQKTARMKAPQTQEGRTLSHPAFPLARKKTCYLSALSMSATMHSTDPQPEQPWQLPHPLRGLSLSPQ